MSLIEDAIQEYNDLFDDARAAETWEQLTATSRARRLAFGDRLLCTVLRPHLLTADEYASIRQACAVLLGAFRAAYKALMADPALRAELDLTPPEEQALHIDPGYVTPTPTSRLDSFFTHGHDPGDPGTLHFVEYNAETPAGGGYEDLLGQTFFELPAFREFGRRYQVEAIPVRPMTLTTLLDVYHEAGGRERPTIGIIDWAGVPTTNEFYIYQEFFEREGVPTLIAPPEELEYDGTHLTHRGRPIHLVYKRVLAGELLRRFGLDHPIIHALRDGNLIMANGFRCKLLHKKMIFAILSDERHTRLYTTEQRRAIREHIPWTRKLAERTTQIDGRAVDLLPHVSTHKDEFVLKPNDEYGGTGVVLGWDVSQQEWEAALREGLSTSTIVQRKVTIASELFPAFVDGQLSFSPRLVDLDPYLFKGEFAHGCLTRLSGGGLLNVSAGGGSVVPTFIVHRRKGD
ncbi:MAG: hypothetical protein M5U01_25960 [Ardenticatenaceae bacterium]|nr:hypothetical protein [Ardenticatenaceae bacterium]HBY99517.1 hypothetical protein [Chloroflexota bacterium]